MKPVKIMIADDDDDDRELLRFLFNMDENFELVGCYSLGSEVIEAIIDNKNEPDVLIIDMYMPIISGLEVLDKLNLGEHASTTTKFIISTTINELEQSNYASNELIKFIKKPVSLKEINDLPGEILETLNLQNNRKI